MKILKFAGRNVFRLAIFGFTAAAMVWLWFEWPEILVAGFDYNLAAMKWVSGCLPEAWSFRTEAALRALSMERTMFFGEASVVVRAILASLRRLVFPVGRE
jgi:hypothetical protein